MQSLHNIYTRFQLDGEAIACSRFGMGHINETYLLVTNHAHLYILQKLNGHVFANRKGLMDNVIAVTAHIRKKVDDPRRVLTLVHTLDDEPYLIADDGEYWRLAEYITGGLCYEMADSAELFRQSGAAFGQFQNLLADFPASSLVETIPHFHDTPERFRQLHAAIEEDKVGRVASVQAEIEAFLSREGEAGALMQGLQKGELPLRVTHNDTKLNNVLLSETDKTPLCVIDLDTVMPGLSVCDFGDSIRYGASTAAEDEVDLSKVSLSLALYRAYSEGFLSACGKRLAQAELAALPLGAKLITLENGTRFLADYLNGDTYYRIDHARQNLDRCRTQLKLVEDMERKWDNMLEINRSAAAGLDR